MDLPKKIYNPSNRKVAVHYAIYNSKQILHYGTSRVCGKKHSKPTIHAEEMAFKYIHVLKKKKKNKGKKLNIIIWRFDKDINPKAIYCCAACTKLVKKHKFENNIFTIYNDKFKKAIISDPKPSIGNLIRHLNK